VSGPSADPPQGPGPWPASRADAFIRLFNEIDQHLRETTGLPRHFSFGRLVDEAAASDATLRQFAGQLKDYAMLRNAIVHHEAYPDEIIAEPNARALAEFEAAVAAVVRPERLIPRFARKLRIFAPAEPMVAALQYMREHDYAQVVVAAEAGLRLLTVEGVARWVERQAERGRIDVGDATVAQAIALEPPGTFLLMARELTIADAREAFQRSIMRRQPRLYAVIVTGPAGQPLGIVTPWDLFASL
jgi:CBS domain-containing protein